MQTFKTEMSWSRDNKKDKFEVKWRESEIQQISQIQDKNSMKPKN